MPFIDKVNVGSTIYDIHDARITGGVLNFRGAIIASDYGIADGVTRDINNDDTASFVSLDDTLIVKEGDVVIDTDTGKEFVFARIPGDPVDKMKVVEFGDATDMGGTELAYVTSTTSYTPQGSVNNSSTTITSSGSNTPSGTVALTQPTDGTSISVTVSYTPSGTIALTQPTDGTAITVTGSYDKATSFSGTAETITSVGNYTPSGTISVVLPTVSKKVVSAVNTASIGQVTNVSTMDAIIAGGVLNETVVTGVTTASIGKVNSVSTASKNVVSSVSTASIGTVTNVAEEWI